jgi:nucleoside-diphosphate-sugar epimerase
MNTAIVTGATSYLGIELVARLTQENYEVHVIIRSGSDIVRLIDQTPGVNVHTHKEDEGTLTNIFSTIRPDIVFHLASKYVREEAPENIKALISSNITFGSQVLEAAANSGVKNFINTGSYFQFNSGGKPPINLYGVAKKAFSEILNYYTSLNKFYSTSLIIYDVYGPGDWRMKLFSNITKSINKNLPLSIPKDEILLYPVYYSDVIDCFLLAAKKLQNEPTRVSGKSWAVRNKDPHKITEIIAIFEQASGKKIIINHGDWPKPTREIESIWRGKTLPDWHPNHSLLDGIKSMLKE